MVVRNCNKLLSELTRIEEKIVKCEKCLKSCKEKLDMDQLLEEIFKNHLNKNGLPK